MCFQTIYLLFAASISLQAECMTLWKNSHYLEASERQTLLPEGSENHAADYEEVDREYHSPLDVHDEHQHFSSYQGPIAVPVVLASGHLADTYEVAEAKSHHLGAVVEAKADQYYNGHQKNGYGGAYGYSSSHKGYGIPVVLPNGHIADTLEVAAAKASHLLTLDKIKYNKFNEEHDPAVTNVHDDSYKHEHSGSIHGYGIPVILPSGHIADTYEVAAAKSAHKAAVAFAKEQDHFPSNHHALTYQQSQNSHQLVQNVQHKPLFDPHHK